MSRTNADPVTEVVRPDGTPTDDSPEATIVERRRPLPTGIPADRPTERDLEGTVTEGIETGPVVQPSRPLASQAAPRPASPGAPPLPRWVLPYMLGCIALLLAGAFVLWTQARVLGHF